jgi:hypothetical protein
MMHRHAIVAVRQTAVRTRLHGKLTPVNRIQQGISDHYGVIMLLLGVG